MHELVLKNWPKADAQSAQDLYGGQRAEVSVLDLLPDVMDEESLKLELQKIQKIFEEPVADNFTEHDISASIGVSVFPSREVQPKNLSNRPFFPFKRPRKKAAGGCRFRYLAVQFKKPRPPRRI